MLCTLSGKERRGIILAGPVNTLERARARLPKSTGRFLPTFFILTCGTPRKHDPPRVHSIERSALPADSVRRCAPGYRWGRKRPPGEERRADAPVPAT